jgi:antitoxin component HigA of HigAB toxin-antitoxin module
METIGDKLKMIRHTQIISDPFPEQSEYELMLQTRSKAEKFFGLGPTKIEAPRPISIWKAYMIGYEKTYKEIESAIGSRPLAEQEGSR